MKKLIVPVFGLLLAACTYQFAPTASDDTRLLNTESSGETTTTAGINFPPADPDPSGPGGPDGPSTPGAPDPGDDGGGGSMPDMPDFPG